MLQKKEPALETERLTLREFKKSDCPAIHKYGTDPETVKYMPWGPNTLQDTKDFLQRVISHQQENPRRVYNFALIQHINHKLIGACAISIRNVEFREGEIGYVLNRQYWNQGYMTEAAHRMLGFGFQELALHRISATCDPANIGSYRVMEKVGMQREGYLREHLWMKGRWRDSLLYSILDREWHSSHRNGAISGAVNNSKFEIEYLEISPADLEKIRLLWEKLLQHHKTISKYFKERPNINFDMRKKQFEEKSLAGALRVDLAKDSYSGELVGYCVTSLNLEKQGEIESIYVENDYRGFGIGDQLMTRALRWLESQSVKKTILGVGEGNESVFNFYRRYHFYPRTTILEQKQDFATEGVRQK